MCRFWQIIYRGLSTSYVKHEHLKIHINQLGFRAIERVKNVHPTTIINGVKQVGKLLPNFWHSEITPQVEELHELETFVGSKKTKHG